MNAEWCECSEKIIPAGVMAIYQDGKFHAPDSLCAVTDDLSPLTSRMAAIRAEVAA